MSSTSIDHLQNKYKKLSQRCYSLSQDLDNCNLKENAYKINELQITISELNELIPLNQTTSDKTIPDLIVRIKDDIKIYEQKLAEYNKNYLNFNEMEYYKKLNSEKLRKLREEKANSLNEKFNEFGKEAKKTKNTARIINDYLSKEDAVIINNLSGNVNNTKNKTEQSKRSLEQYLSNSGILNYHSNSCLWITALIELLIMFLLLAV